MEPRQMQRTMNEQRYPLSPYREVNAFGRIFCSAKNRALRGYALTRSGPGYAVAKPLQSLAR
jgi:hypothetical protein